MTGDWKRMTEFDRLLLFRAVRPDRLTMAMRRFVAGVLGIEYTTSRPFDLEVACQVNATRSAFNMSCLASSTILRATTSSVTYEPLSCGKAHTYK